MGFNSYRGCLNYKKIIENQMLHRFFIVLPSELLALKINKNPYN